MISGTPGLNLILESCKELVGQFAGHTTHKPGAKLGKLATNLCIDLVGERGAVFMGRQLHPGAALGKTGRAALALAADPVAVGRIDFINGDHAVECRPHRSDLLRDLGRESFIDRS